MYTAAVADQSDDQSLTGGCKMNHYVANKTVDRFLHDIIIQDNHCVIFFATVAGFARLALANRWFFDGTLKICSELFTQLGNVCRNRF
jgi:hypothetical protein